MRLLLDTNVILDLLESREPFAEDAEKIFALAESDRVIECVSASAVTDIYYLLRKNTKDKALTRAGIDQLLSVLTILPVTGEILRYAYHLDWDDFEDAVQYSAAKFHYVDIIITRNKDDYEEPELEIMTPAEFLAFFAS